MRTRTSLIFGVLLGTTALAVACSSPDAGARVDPIGPDAEQFKAVAPVLVRRCGSIDCHGSVFRNFRLYGYGATRLTPGDRPDAPVVTLPTEASADYDAVIGLEPEIMRDVVRAGGAGYERLTLVRKGRNAEDHKGGQRMAPGDKADRCLVAWLSGVPDPAACKTASCVDPTNCEP
ncbi:hypothetical protein BH11MYX4_BH11MYX4_68240 [soil metagenome]